MLLLIDPLFSLMSTDWQRFGLKIRGHIGYDDFQPKGDHIRLFGKILAFVENSFKIRYFSLPVVGGVFRSLCLYRRRLYVKRSCETCGKGP